MWTSTQAQFRCAARWRGALGLPMSDVRVIGMAVGGGFGGKGGADPRTHHRRARPPLPAAREAGDDARGGVPGQSPLRRGRAGTQDRGEEGRRAGGAGGAPALRHRRLRRGADRYRRGTAAGAVPHSAPAREGLLGLHQQALRGRVPCPTAPHVHFAIESQIDIIAHALGLDPLEMRLRNVMGKGDPVTGGVMPYSLPEKVIRAAAERAGWTPAAQAAAAGTRCAGSGSPPGTGPAGPPPPAPPCS